MDSFSWIDSLRATVSTCLPCFTSRGSASDSEEENDGRLARRGEQTRYEELDGLLRDAEGTDGDAETLSLHSNIGDGQRRRRKKRRHYKTIRVFGYHLFGRPPIQLSDSEDETDSHSRRRRPGRLAIGQLGSAHSSSSAEAFDSDASPLDPAIISQLSPQDAAVRAARTAAEREAEEQRRRQEQAEKEERRRRRRERRELKRAAAALANGAPKSMDGEEFEGFLGSGSLRPPFSPGSHSSIASPSVPRWPNEEFGSYVGGGAPAVHDADDPADADADFGGEAYIRKASSRGSDSSRSHTHSQTSASHSNADSSQYYPVQLPYGFQSSPRASPNNLASKFEATATNRPSSGPLLDASRQKKKSKRSSNSATTSSKKSSSSPTSQSGSLPSLDSQSDSSFPRKLPPSEPFAVEHDEIVRNALDVDAPKESTESKFPTVGFGGVRRTSSTGSGVFLARRGDD